MNRAGYFFQLKRFLGDLMKSMSEAVVFQLHRTKQEIGSLSESAVSNNNDSQLRLNALEKKILSKDAVAMLKDTSSTCQLVDKFRFGTTKEQMVFESFCFKWTIKNFEQLVPRFGRYVCKSGIFPVYGFQLEAQLRITIKSDGNFRLHMRFIDEERGGQQMDIKPPPVVTFIIKDLNGQNRSIIKNYNFLFNKSPAYNKFVLGSSSISKSQWNALLFPCDKSMEILVLAEPHSIIIKPLSVSGTIIDTIQHFSRKLQMVKDGLNLDHISPAFLTHVGGYRVVVLFQLNVPFGKTKKGLLAEMWFLSGEFDSQLGSEFKHETSITFINHFDAKKNIIFKQQANEAKYYPITFISEDKVDSGGFLLNDTLTYHVIIKTNH